MEPEIVWKQTQSHRALVEDNPHGVYETDTSLSIFKSDNKVALVSSALYTGRASQTSEKRYWYWKTTNSEGFIRTSTGLIQPYSCYRKRTAKNWTARTPIRVLDMMDEFSATTEFSKEFRKAVFDTFNVRTMQDIYPISNYFGVTKYIGIPYNLRRAFRQSDLHGFTEETFGKSRMSDKLVAAVAVSDPWFIALAKEFRGYVSNDSLVKFLNETGDWDTSSLNLENAPFVRPLLRASGEGTGENLLSTALNLTNIDKIHVTSAMVNRAARRGFRRSLNRTGASLASWTDAQQVVCS